jgi:hypothetical protein
MQSYPQKEASMTTESKTIGENCANETCEFVANLKTAVSSGEPSSLKEALTANVASALSSSPRSKFFMFGVVFALVFRFSRNRFSCTHTRTHNAKKKKKKKKKSLKKKKKKKVVVCVVDVQSEME